MIKMEIKQWKRELKKVCVLETEDEFNQFDKLISQVTGKEGEQVLSALIDAVQPIEDYGAYEALHNAFWKFKPDVFSETFVKKFPSLLERVPVESAQDIGRFLCPLCGWAKKKYLPVFKSEVQKASSRKRKVIETWFAENVHWFNSENVLIN